MKKRLLVLICCVGLIATGAQAGLFKDSVDLADLSEVSPDSLQTLKETEFAVFVAQVRLNTAKAAENAAEGGIKAANRILDAENLDKKAAKAELKAANANKDAERMKAATALMTGTGEDLQTAEALRKWKVQEREARVAEVSMAKSALDLAEAKRDTARVTLLSQENTPSSGKYDANDFERNVAKRQKEYDAASRKAREKMDKADKLKIEWERVAKNVELVEAE